MKTLSEKRIRLLKVIGGYQQRGTFPLVRELAAELGLARQSSINRMLQALVEECYLNQQGGGNERRQRIYTLTPKGEAVVPTGTLKRRFPVLGSIPAGLLAEAMQECDEFIDPGDVLHMQPGDFFLKVEGDSMIGDNILPNDLVQLRPGVQIHNSEIAAVQIKQSEGIYEGTLKHVHFQPGRKMVRLKASNPAYAEMTLPGKDVEIVGVYQGLIRPQVSRRV